MNILITPVNFTRKFTDWTVLSKLVLVKYFSHQKINGKHLLKDATNVTIT